MKLGPVLRLVERDFFIRLLRTIRGRITPKHARKISVKSSSDDARGIEELESQALLMEFRCHEKDTVFALTLGMSMLL